MNHARTFCALRLGSEAMELFDEERERVKRGREEREITDDPSLAEHRATGEKH